MLATVRPRDIAGKTGRRLAAEEVADLVAVDVKLERIKELKAAVTIRGLGLMAFTASDPRRCRQSAGGRRRRRPVRRPKPVRVEQRHRAPGRHVRGADPPPTLTCGNRRVNRFLHVAAIVQISAEWTWRCDQPHFEPSHQPLWAR